MNSTTARRAELGRDLLALLSLLAAVSVLLWPVVFAGRVPLPDYLRLFLPWADGRLPDAAWNPLWYDGLGQYWTWRTLLAESWREGQLPLWNPYQFRGYAFCANGQSALWYPLNWLGFGLLSVAAGFRLTAVAHLWLAAAGCYWCLRELGARRPAAVCAGLVYALSGFMVTWLMLPTLVSSAAWLPVGLAAVERARRTGRCGPGLAVGGAIGLAALAGHPQIFHYVAVTIAAVGAVRLLPAGWRAWLLGLVVGGLLAAVVLLPLLELAPLSHRPPDRSETGYGMFLGRRIPTDRLLSLVLPKLHGSPERGTVTPTSETNTLLRQVAAGRYWGSDSRGAISGGDYTEFNLHVGVLALLLAGLACARGGPARCYGAVALLALLLAFGTPLNRPLYFWLPGYGAGAGPCRLAAVWSVGLAICAGLGLDALLSRPATRRELLAALAGLALLTALGWWLAARRAAGDSFTAAAWETATWRNLLALLAATGWLAGGAVLASWRPAWLVVLITAELLRAGLGFNPTSPAKLLDPRPPALAAIAAGDRLLAGDPPGAWGFYRPPVGLILPPNLATSARVRDAGGYDSLMPGDYKRLLFDTAGGHHPTPAANSNMMLLGHLPASDLPADLGVRWLATATAAGWGWVERDGDGADRLPGGRFVVDGLNRVTVTSDQAGPLRLRDSAYPGWHCLAGPSAAPRDWRAVDGVREVTAAAGELVRWVYRPAALRAGQFASLLGLSLLAAGLALGRRRSIR